MTGTAHYRMVDSRRMNEPLTTQAEAIDDLIAHVLWSVTGPDQPAVLTLIGVIKNCQVTLCDLAYKTQPPL